jgi:hypothetical protein
VANMSLSFLAMLIKVRNGRDLYLASSDIMVVQKKKVVMLLMLEKLSPLKFNLSCYGVWHKIVSCCIPVAFLYHKSTKTYECFLFTPKYASSSHYSSL